MNSGDENWGGVGVSGGGGDGDISKHFQTDHHVLGRELYWVLEEVGEGTTVA